MTNISLLVAGIRYNQALGSNGTSKEKQDSAITTPLLKQCLQITSPNFEIW